MASNAINPQILALLVAAVTQGGCATLTVGTQQALRLEPANASGQPLPGAQCTLHSDRESRAVDAGQSVKIARSLADLSIDCRLEGQPPATALLISRVNAPMFGNAMFMFGVGSLVDRWSGAGFTYPEWIQPIFGEHHIFDQRDAKSGLPTPPRRTGAQSDAVSTEPETMTHPATSSTAPATLSAPADALDQ